MFQMDLLCTGVTSLYSHSYFIKGLPDLHVWIISLAPKLNNTGPIFWKGLSKIKFFIDIYYFSVEAVEASQSYFFENWF